ncbi:MAG: hypothetical protein V1798_09005 [Pseudomonadota bacterium]
MKRIFFSLLLVSIATPQAMATTVEGGQEAQYVWVRDTAVLPQFKIQMGLGSLGRDFNGHRGLVITNFFGAEFEAVKDASLSVGLPLAGTLSAGPDNYGIGNVMVGGKYVVPLDRLRLALGIDVALPTAQNRSAVGLFTPRYFQYVKDQVAASPYLALSHVGERLTATLAVSPDIQVFTTVPAGFDKTELVLSYDGALAYTFFENIWLTTEFGGHSSLTYTANHTAFFGGAGVRYQDNEISVGGHLWAPFTAQERDRINLMAAFDLRVLF